MDLASIDLDILTYKCVVLTKVLSVRFGFDKHREQPDSYVQMVVSLTYIHSYFGNHRNKHFFMGNMSHCGNLLLWVCVSHRASSVVR